MPWNTLWFADPGYNPTGTAAAILLGTTHPQGNQAGVLGALYIRTTNGQLYEKRGGGSTAFGWYPATPDDPSFYGWQPRGAVGSCFAKGLQLPDAAGNPTTIFASTPSLSGSATPFDPQRQYMGGITSGVINNSFLCNPGSTLSGYPTAQLGGGFTVANSWLDWDAFFDVVTTPRSSTVAGAMTLASLRMYAVMLMQNSTIQANGGLGNTDALYTEFASSLLVGNGSYGIGWRFSTSAADSAWQVLTANDNGAVAAQTVTTVGAAVAVDTIYRLRLRCQMRAGVPTLLASINDGTESVITGNVGPGSVPAAATARFLCPYFSCRQLVGATAKGMAITNVSVWYGASCAA